MKILGAEEKELLRHAVLECVVSRHPAALPASGIRRRVLGEVDFRFEEEDVDGALEFLRGNGWVRFDFDEMGQSKWWSATAAGVLKVERGQNA